MPKVILFLPCEKLLTDENKSLTFVSLCQDLNLAVAHGVDIPAELVIQKDWKIISLIRHSDPAEIGKKFLHHVEVIKPDGTIMVRASKIPFVLPQISYLTRVDVSQFPVGQQGRLCIKLWVYEAGQPQPEQPSATYDEINIFHRRVDEEKLPIPAALQEWVEPPRETATERPAGFIEPDPFPDPGPNFQP
jgi:hypothetical protein